MSARDYSVMPVQLVDESTPVEFGATWATRGGRQQRVNGQWFACRIVRHEGAIVHVELMPDVRLVRHEDRRKKPH